MIGSARILDKMTEHWPGQDELGGEGPEEECHLEGRNADSSLPGICLDRQACHDGNKLLPSNFLITAGN